MAQQEELLRQFQDDGEQDEELSRDVFVDVARKGLDVGAVSVDHGRMRARQLGYELGDVVDLGVVEDPRAHLAQAERLVPVVPAVLQVGAVLELLLRREFEDFPADGELLVYLLLREAEIDNVEESLNGGFLLC